jgi:glucose repression regulatory protein TUP1
VSMSSDSRWVVSGSKDRCVHVWDSQTAVLQLMLQGHKNSGELSLFVPRCGSRADVDVLTVISLDLNSANDLLATGSGDSYARICECFCSCVLYDGSDSLCFRRIIGSLTRAS